jgi:hypothetical protein
MSKPVNFNRKIGKIVKNLILLLFVCLFSCKKDPMPISITQEVSQGEFILNMNGTQLLYQDSITSVDSNRYHLGLFEKRANGTETRGLGLSFIMKRAGCFEFTTKRDAFGPTPSESILVSFVHVVEEDLRGYKYSYDDDKDNFFYVEKLDELNRTVKGEGRVQFNLTSKNGWSFPDLPDHMVLEFKFFLDY